jgi:uncharacterized protein
MKTVTEFPRAIFEQADVGIIMPDGCRLSARIWMPVDAMENPVPVVLEHLPYRKRDGTIARDSLTHPYLAGHGYACIRTDMRGNGESQGLMADEYSVQELEDAYSVLAWAAQQPWSNGKAGMMGISWGGFNCLQVAAMQPASLKAVISICSTVDRYADDIHYKGGCLLNENFGWSANMLSYSSRPPDPELVGEKWRDMWLNRLENMPFLILTWLRHPTRDAYWKHGSICEDFTKVKAAVLSIGGWHDGYRNTVSHLVSNIEAPVKGIVGPWIHKYPHFAAPKPSIGFLQEALRWWDHWLKDKETGVENDPAYRVWLMDSVEPAPWLPERPGRWIAERSWPNPLISNRIYFLTDAGLSAETGPLSAIVSSAQDTGLCAGEYFPFTYGPELPDEQSADDAQSLVFDGAPLEQTLDIVGAPMFKFSFECDQPNALIYIRLCDVFPDGRSALITYGMLNLTHFDSHETPQALEKGRVYEAQFALDQIAYSVPAGHKLRVAIATSSWPTLWPSPVKSTLLIHGASTAVPRREHVRDAADACFFEGPEGAKPWQAENIRKAVLTRETVRQDDGTSVLTVMNDFGADRDLEHDLVSGSSTIEKWSIHPDDPLSANAEISWVQENSRGDWSVRTQTHCAMWSDAAHFYVTASLKAFEGERLVFEREYEDKIERGLL